jgi:hypothetical protein
MHANGLPLPLEFLNTLTGSASVSIRITANYTVRLQDVTVATWENAMLELAPS